jgi:hypothetical protein
LAKPTSVIWPSSCGLHLVVEIGEDLALGVDRDRARVLGNRDVGDEGKPSEVTIWPSGERLSAAVAGIGRDAGRHLDLEIAAALDRDVEIAARRAQRALLERHRHRRRPHAEAELHAGGQHRARRRVDRARARDLLVVQVGELRAARVVAGRAHVREVVRDDLDPHLLGLHARRRDLKRLHVGRLLTRAKLWMTAGCARPRVRGSLAEFVGALDLDHPRDLSTGETFEAFEEALHDPARPSSAGTGALVERETRAPLAHARSDPGPQADLGDRHTVGAQRAVGGDGDRASAGTNTGAPPASRSGMPSGVTSRPPGSRVKRRRGSACRPQASR